MLISARVLVISDFSCPFCFTLNEWITELKLSDQVRWFGIEHRASLPLRGHNDSQDQKLVADEVRQVQERAPEVNARLPQLWSNSRLALTYQAAIEDDYPEQAALLRQRIFRLLWRDGGNLADVSALQRIAEELELPAPQAIFRDEELLAQQTAWWAKELDRIPAMIAPTGARHLGLQDYRTVEAFLKGALFDPPPAAGCQ